MGKGGGEIFWNFSKIFTPALLTTLVHTEGVLEYSSTAVMSHTTNDVC